MTKSPPENGTDGLDPDIRDGMDNRLGSVVPGEAQLLARVKARVMRAVQAEAAAGITLRAEAGSWRKIAPGIEQKVLWGSPREGSFLLRCAPGAALGPHAHRIDEECLVLEGTLRIGEDLLLGPGDFHVGRAGSRHPRTHTETGALLYLRGALEC